MSVVIDGSYIGFKMNLGRKGFIWVLCGFFGSYVFFYSFFMYVKWVLYDFYAGAVNLQVISIHPNAIPGQFT